MRPDGHAGRGLEEQESGGPVSRAKGNAAAAWVATYLKTGQYILTHHRLPVPDPFAYTTAGAAPAYPGEAATRHFNLTHEWLAQAERNSRGKLAVVVYLPPGCGERNTGKAHAILPLHKLMELLVAAGYAPAATIEGD